MDMIKYATICAAAAASLTACGGGVSHDAATTGQSVAPLATSESASPCSSATADVLKSATQREYGQPGKALDGPFTVEKVLCSGDWAKTLIDVEAPPDTNPGSIVLFHHDGADWRAVNYGSGFDCRYDGVPPSIAAELEC